MSVIFHRRPKPLSVARSMPAVTRPTTSANGTSLSTCDRRRSTGQPGRGIPAVDRAEAHSRACKRPHHRRFVHLHPRADLDRRGCVEAPLAGVVDQEVERAGSRLAITAGVRVDQIEIDQRPHIIGLLREGIGGAYPGAEVVDLRIALGLAGEARNADRARVVVPTIAAGDGARQQPWADLMLQRGAGIDDVAVGVDPAVVAANGTAIIAAGEADEPVRRHLHLGPARRA